MTPYLLIFVNSLQSAFIFSLTSEYAWTAARLFGGYNMLLATLLALLGATLGMGLNFSIGYLLSGSRGKWFHFSDGAYMRISKISRRYVVLLLLFSPLPFLSLVALFLGLFRVSPAVAISFIALGRLGYYGYYLLHL